MSPTRSARLTNVQPKSSLRIAQKTKKPTANLATYAPSGTVERSPNNFT